MAGLKELLGATYRPVKLAILGFLDIADIAALAQTCRDLDLRLVLQGTIYNVNYHLRGYFSDLKKFRTVQGECDALICGHFSRRFLAGNLRGDETLAIIRNRNNLTTMQKFLEKEEYTEYESSDHLSDFPHFAKATTSGTARILIIAHCTDWRRDPASSSSCLDDCRAELRQLEQGLLSLSARNIHRT